mmetsp:Transcript_91805/g.273940  ORF Transcript_91805/g.273940 Transcript_91805/m.273940 type:complete len:349 (-) Transcript_91805:83-1129(-)
MAACMAPPWPSQRRAGGGTSERHTALARMRERRAGRTSPDVDEESWPPPRPPVRLKGGTGTSDSRSLPPARSSEQPAAPWSPAWTPDSPRPRLGGADVEELTPRVRPPAGEPPRRRPSRGGSERPRLGEPGSVSDGARRDETPREERPPREERAPRRAERAPVGDSPGAGRARGARGGAEDDEPLPPGIQGADFKTLQEMIARGIQDSETGASKFEAMLSDDETDLKRHREMMRKRRDDEAAEKQKERDAARQRRRREDEERLRRQREALEEEFGKEQREREERQEVEQLCRREMKAVTRIQALFRGRRSRAGACISAPAVVAELHAEPWASSAPASRRGSVSCSVLR